MVPPDCPLEKRLTSKDYWDSANEGFAFVPMPASYVLVKLIYRSFESTDVKSVLEIGCFPGRFLYHFGVLGYELNGIDYTQNLSAMERWLRRNRFRVGCFVQKDICEVGYRQQYDVVFSSGFVEHFTNFEQIIRIHTMLVKPGGCVVITAPNFAGTIQRRLHQVLDRENLSRHHLPSMDVDKWRHVLTAEGFTIVRGGYYGGFDFWVDKQERNVVSRLAVRLIRCLTPIRCLPNTRAYSPEILIIGRKSRGEGE